MGTLAIVGITVAAAAIAAGLSVYLTVSLTKKQRRTILKEAEAEGEMIKKEKIEDPPGEGKIHPT